MLSIHLNKKKPVLSRLHPPEITKDPLDHFLCWKKTKWISGYVISSFKAVELVTKHSVFRFLNWLVTCVGVGLNIYLFSYIAVSMCT